MYRSVFFDLDGTLLNTLGDLAAAGNYALRTLGFGEHPVDKYRYMVGNGIPKLIERMLPENAESALREKAHELFAAYYAEHSEDTTCPYEGIQELLEELTGAGITTAVITNKDNVYAGKLIEKYFGGLVSKVYGSLPGTPHKPDPYWVNKAIEELGLVREEILYVGDSSVDIQTAKNAGLASAGVLWGFRTEQELKESGADHICSFPGDIMKVVMDKLS